jgi:predicted amidophosphoribosyltransferase
LPTAEEITDPHLRTYTRVLPAGDGVCDVCHGAPGAGFQRCWSCYQTTRQVSNPVRLVVPVSLTQLLGQLHHVLRSYKSDAYPQATRAAFGLQVSAILTRFLARHRRCIRDAAAADWNCITIVPSSAGRSGAHPLEGVIQMSSWLNDQYRPLLQAGSESAQHIRASDHAYVATDDVNGLSVLLLDDTFTSGARAQSAASALGRAGAQVIAMVPVGRVINPEFSAEAAALLTRARSQPFDFNRCCVHLEAGQ